MATEALSSPKIHRKLEHDFLSVCRLVFPMTTVLQKLSFKEDSAGF